MKFVFADAETYYSNDYTLRDMDPASYILDERFALHCLGVAEGFTGVPYIVDGPDIPHLLKDLGTNVCIVTHNALFDACILNWRYNYLPRMLADTLGIARTVLGHRLRSLALRKVAAYFGLVDDKATIPKAKGMTRADIIANGLWPEYTRDCLNDTAFCRAIFAQLVPHLPGEELILHDMILRCAVDPAFEADVGLLHQNLAEVEENKTKLFVRAMYAGLADKDELMSNEQFAQLLIRTGCIPPQKVSPTTGRRTWAFAKTDRNFLALLEDDDPRVVALVEARLAFKTTLEQTRSQRMINIAELTWPRKGQMPIPLKIGAAHTHRLGGDWKLNPQNWGRASLIRKAMRAPAGHKVVVGDSEQIEARITAWFCEQWDLVEQFRKGEDVYANFASDIFGYKVNKVDHPGPRFVGKTGILQLGFQCAHIKFRNTVWLLSYKYEKEAIDLSEQEASRIVEGFRNRFGKIKGMWDRLKNVIAFMCQRSIDAEQFMEIGPIRFGRERMIGPNGLQMNYHNLRYDHASMQWLYEYGDVTHKLYGGKLLENIVQFLARIAVMQAAVNLRKKLLTYSCRFVHTSHDELVYIVLDKDVEAVKATLKEEMGRTPAWAPGLPLRASVDSGDTYGDAK